MSVILILPYCLSLSFNEAGLQLMHHNSLILSAFPADDRKQA